MDFVSDSLANGRRLKCLTVAAGLRSTLGSSGIQDRQRVLAVMLNEHSWAK